MEALNVEIKQAGYSENTIIIHDIHFKVNPGELVGLIGPNGAGKSTIIKSILELLPHVTGTVFRPEKHRYAYIPEHPVYYEELTLWEHIEMAKAINGLEGSDYDKQAEELLALFRLTDEKHHFPTSFSKGMQQKLMIIIAILIKPELYIVDEPFIGLDPKAIKDLLMIFEQERKRGAAILMSTHVLDTAERICDRFLLINHGDMIAQGTLADVRQQSGVDGSLLDCFYELMEITS
ncbi:ABC transporter ATP-binding protein [Salipaludibacillus sp. LMS25]|jgi:ABC-2 type transport system ATP-binding protein|uniref:ABC transporter ATP-binding protein n=1 Tax=Salipaludibacillus sp. LMS25 TaxID=2924031 RepID=UPI0020D010AC|nr:ABC transporter ATP-binding protein [Salipaludibacillus sp. LMS25]UTR13670.1 ABC transporter ATP-binding protein [Salipaludibacillus sp. LMS25]